MSHTVISIESLSKAYRLGQISTGTLSRDLKRWWARQRGKPDPLLQIGQADHGNRDGEIIWALKDIGFSVDQGDVLGIIGRNGAGKSTLLKILAEVTAPTSGEVKIQGRVASLLEVGTGFHPELTGRENIFLNGAILGMNKAEIRRKLDAIVGFSGVERFIDTPVKRYSSGMYLRLAFAVAAHLEPEILIVDEVLAVGDADFQRKCLGKMGEVAQEGRTVLFVSHNMGAISTLCHKGILLDEGKIIFNGTADMAVIDYLKRFQETGKKLIDHQTEKSESIQVSDVRINGTDSDQISLEPNNNNISIQITFRTLSEVQVSIYAYLYDAIGKTIGIFSPGHADRLSYVYHLKADVHTLTGNMILPKLTAGDYYLSFGLANPGFMGYGHFEDGIRITVVGSPTSTGTVFQQGGSGYFVIEGTTVRAEN